VVNLLLHAPTVGQSQPRNKPAAARGGVQGVSPWVEDPTKRAEEESDCREESIPVPAPALLGILFFTQRKKSRRPRTIITQANKKEQKKQKNAKRKALKKRKRMAREAEKQGAGEDEDEEDKAKAEDEAEDEDKDEAGAAPEADEASDDDE
jgi:hypothetical protein